MADQKNKIERFKYTVERSEYNGVIHLRMITPDNGKTHVEYYSYKKDDVLTELTENRILQEMENKIDQLINNLDQDKRDKMYADAEFIKSKGDIYSLVKKEKRIWM